MLRPSSQQYLAKTCLHYIQRKCLLLSFRCWLNKFLLDSFDMMKNLRMS
jgi:hypothetical protein